MEDVLSLNRSVGAGDEGEVPVLQHGAGKLVDKGQSLCMEVSEHGIGMPSANESDDVRVNLSAQ
jgi:hypothetical protein